MEGPLYSLVVAGMEGAWDGAPFGLPRDRFGEYTAPALAERFRALDADALAALQALPTVLAYEQGHERPARIAQITRFHHSSRGDLRFSYEVRTDMPAIPPETLAALRDELDIGRLELHRTHWAVKDVDLWEVLRGAGIVTGSDLAYDVALSFAGEDRSYVEQVAVGLREAGVRVFYDFFEEAALWGADLYVHLTDVYAKRARYTVLFASSHYARKHWTSLERRAAQERAFREQAGSILPARFDDTEIPGVLSTTGYVDLRHRTPAQLVALILQKLGRPARSAPTSSSTPSGGVGAHTSAPTGPATFPVASGLATPAPASVLGVAGDVPVDEVTSASAAGTGPASPATTEKFGQFPAHDQAISAWFARQGWPVTRRQYDFDRDVFLWQHEPAGRGAARERRSFRATLTTLEDLSPARFVALVEGGGVADRLRARPHAYLVMRQTPDGQFGVVELDPRA